MFELKSLWNFMLCYVNFKRWVSEAFLMPEEIEYEFVSKIINDYKQNVMNYEIKTL